MFKKNNLAAAVFIAISGISYANEALYWRQSMLMAAYLQQKENYSAMS